jgi:hypothetical protein
MDDRLRNERVLESHTGVSATGVAESLLSQRQGCGDLIHRVSDDRIHSLKYPNVVGLDYERARGMEMLEGRTRRADVKPRQSL